MACSSSAVSSHERCAATGRLCVATSGGGQRLNKSHKTHMFGKWLQNTTHHTPLRNSTATATHRQKRPERMDHDMFTVCRIDRVPAFNSGVVFRSCLQATVKELWCVPCVGVAWYVLGRVVVWWLLSVAGCMTVVEWNGQQRGIRGKNKQAYCMS